MVRNCVSNLWHLNGTIVTISQGLEEGANTASRYVLSFGGDGNVLELAMVAQSCDYTKNH